MFAPRDIPSAIGSLYLLHTGLADLLVDESLFPSVRREIRGGNKAGNEWCMYAACAPGAGAAWLPPQAPCRPRDRRQSMHTPALLELTKHALLVALPGTLARVRYTLAAGPWAAFRFQENELVKHVFAHEICIARNVPEPGASKCPRARRLQASAVFCRFSEPSFQMVKACFACPSSSPKALLMGLFLGKQAPIDVGCRQEFDCLCSI